MSDPSFTKPQDFLVVSVGNLEGYDPSLAFNFYNVLPEERTTGWQDLLVEKHAKERATEHLEGCYDDGFSFEENELHNDNALDYYLNEVLIFPVTPNFQFPNTVEFRQGTHIACWVKKDEYWVKKYEDSDKN